MGQIEGVLFDSGDTLVRPKAGSWFPRQHFIDAFQSHGITGARMACFDAALADGVWYLDDHHEEATTDVVATRQFRAAYRSVLRRISEVYPE